jgi:peptidyl-prolyl cis-trans isomerase C
MKLDLTSDWRHILTPAVTALAVFSLTACGGEAEPVAEMEPAATESAAAVDLSEATDMFEEEAAAPATDRALAKVGETEIMESDLRAEMQMLMNRFEGQVPPEQMAQMQQQLQQGAMDQLIVKQLLINEVEAQQVEVSEEDIEAQIAELQGQIPGGDLEAQLAQMNMTMDAFRENLTLELSVQKLMENQIGEIAEPDEAAITAFYNEHTNDYFATQESVSAKHILINARAEDDEATRAAARAKADELRQQLLEGADFSELAMAESDCPSSAEGGDLGSFGRGRMVPEFEEAAFNQEIGAIGDVVETQFGYHIIQVADRSAGGVQPLDDQGRERINQFLMGQEREEKVRAYIESLREQTDIEMMP